MISKVNDNAHCIQMNQLHTTVSVIYAKYIKIVEQNKIDIVKWRKLYIDGWKHRKTMWKTFNDDIFVHTYRMKNGKTL